VKFAILTIFNVKSVRAAPKKGPPFLDTRARRRARARRARLRLALARSSCSLSSRICAGNGPDRSAENS
jgi:hypothetical protein